MFSGSSQLSNVENQSCCLNSGAQTYTCMLEGFQNHNCQWYNYLRGVSVSNWTAWDQLLLIFPVNAWQYFYTFGADNTNACVACGNGISLQSDIRQACQHVLFQWNTMKLTYRAMIEQCRNSTTLRCCYPEILVLKKGK